MAQDGAKLFLFGGCGGQRGLRLAVGLIRQSGVPRGVRFASRGGRLERSGRLPLSGANGRTTPGPAAFL